MDDVKQRFMIRNPLTAGLLSPFIGRDKSADMGMKNPTAPAQAAPPPPAPPPPPAQPPVSTGVEGQKITPTWRQTAADNLANIMKNKPQQGDQKAG